MILFSSDNGKYLLVSKDSRKDHAGRLMFTTGVPLRDIHKADFIDVLEDDGTIMRAKARDGNLNPTYPNRMCHPALLPSGWDYA